MASHRAFFGVSALLFVASVAVTIVWCASMSAMGEMPMPGGWMMSMTWMRMPGQTWSGAAASFLGTWIVMMVAMMLPSLTPMLWRYHQAAGRTGETRLGRLTALVDRVRNGRLIVHLSFALLTLRSEPPLTAVPTATGTGLDYEHADIEVMLACRLGSSESAQGGVTHLPRRDRAVVGHGDWAPSPNALRPHLPCPMCRLER